MSHLLLNQESSTSYHSAKAHKQETARDIYHKIFQSTSKKHRAQKCLVTLGQVSSPAANVLKAEEVEQLISLYDENFLQNAFELAKKLTIEFSRSMKRAFENQTSLLDYYME